MNASIDCNVLMIVADYDENGKLLKTTAHEQVIAAGTNTYTLPLQAATGDHSALFILDGVQNVPLCSKTVLPM